MQRLTDVVVEALGDLLPDRAVAAAHVSFPTFVIQATDPRNGRVTIMTDILGGGGGARPGAPGDAAIDSYTSNCALLPAEIAELEFPWRIERTELVEGSGGTGRHAGGAGMLRDYTLLADDGYGIYYVEQTNPAFAARGRDGGGPGAPGAILLRRAGLRHVRAAARQGRGAHAVRRHAAAAGRRRRRLRRCLTLELNLRSSGRAARTRSRSSNFWILPVDVFGISPNTTAFGVLNPASRSRQNAISSASVAAAPGRSSTNAHGTSPQRSSGFATTAAAATAGCR